jgi:HK97 family phage major capsid protein
MKFADTLRAQVAELESERSALLDELDTIASDETRSADEISARADEITARAKAIGEDVKAKLARASELEAIEAERNATPRGPQFLRKPDKADASDVRSMSATQLADTVARNAEENGIDASAAVKVMKRHREERGWLQNLAVRSTDVYAEAFRKMMVGREYDLTAEERAAIGVGTNAQGGFLVPTHLDPTIILTNNGVSNVIRGLARQVTLVNENTWNGITSAGASFSWDAELTEVSDDSPNDFARPSIATHVGQGFVMASYQSFDDIASLNTELAAVLNDGRDRLEAAAHATGSGSGQPTGVFTAIQAITASRVVSTTAATIGLVDLQAIRRGVPVRHRGSSTFLSNPVYADAVKNLGTAVSAAFSTDATQANSDRILGRPFVESDEAPSTQTTTALDPEILVGNFQQYVIVDKPGSTTLQYVPVLFGSNGRPNGSAGWLMRFRSGAGVTDANAFRLLVDRTTA